jgi:hypothetical protein
VSLRIVLRWLKVYQVLLGCTEQSLSLQIFRPRAKQHANSREGSESLSHPFWQLLNAEKSTLQLEEVVWMMVVETSSWHNKNSTFAEVAE